MRKGLVALFLLFSFVSFSANRFWVGGNATWDATAGTKWATTTGGAGGSAVPTSADDVFLDNGTGTGNVALTTGTTCTCKSITCTGYVGTLSGSNLRVFGNITFVAGMTITATGTLTTLATGTLVSAGKTWGGSLISTNTQTLTLSDNWTFSGGVSFTSGGNATFNGNTLYFSGSLTCSGTSLTGTTVLNYQGTTGTWSLTGGTGISNNFVINGSLTVSGTVSYNTGTLTYTSGTVTTTGSTLQLQSCVLNTNGISWNNITFTNSATISLSSNLTALGTLTTLSNLSPAINGAFNVYLGTLDLSTNTTGTLTGTATIIMNGTGFIKSPTSTGYIGINLEVNTSGTITFTNAVRFGGGKTFTYTAGTIASSSGSLVTTTTSATITVNAASVTFPFSVETQIATTFNGTNGFTVGSFTCNTAGVVNTFKDGNTYTITSALSLIGTLASRVQMVSATASSYANLILSMGATQIIVYVSATDIDSHLGQTIWDAQGVLLRTLNWNLLTAMGTISSVN